MSKIKTIFAIVMLANLLTGCKEIADFYLGVPLQPRFDDYRFEPGLNIIGIIRPDSTAVFNNSFVEVQKVVRAIGSNDSLGVDTTQVVVSLINGGDDNKLYPFTLSNHNSAFTSIKYRPDGQFKPKSGDIYKIECEYLDLPRLTAYTIVPNAPVLNENSIAINSKGIYCEIEKDSGIFMLDIYGYSGGTLVAYQRLETSTDVNTGILFTGVSVLDSVSVYGYDYNLANYYLTSNTSLNFNKYRQSYSEVTNGYGVFGSLNKTIYRFR